MPYNHLDEYERSVIKKMLSRGHKKAEIARHLNRHRSTIGKELERNTALWYRPREAQERYLMRRKKSKMKKLDVHPRLQAYVRERLWLYHSPEQIAMRMRLEYPGDRTMRISYESIYRWVYAEAEHGGSLYRKLRRNLKKRQKRMLKKARRFSIPGRKSIHTRPKVVEYKVRRGDWECDLITGRTHDGYIVTLVDRSRLYVVGAPVPDKHPSSLNRSVFEAFGSIPNTMIHTISVDNGTEFYDFKDLEEGLECRVYFADPYSAWQRGTNENTNGLLRQFFPRTMSFRDIDQTMVDTAVSLLNNRPRKRLGYRTPHEAFFKIPVALQA
jgi:transposase, IS30 family